MIELANALEPYLCLRDVGFADPCPGSVSLSAILFAVPLCYFSCCFSLLFLCISLCCFSLLFLFTVSLCCSSSSLFAVSLAKLAICLYCPPSVAALLHRYAWCTCAVYHNASIMPSLKMLCVSSYLYACFSVRPIILCFVAQNLARCALI